MSTGSSRSTSKTRPVAVRSSGPRAGYPLTTLQERIVILPKIDQRRTGAQVKCRRSGSDGGDRGIPRRLTMRRMIMIESLIIWLIIGAIAGWLAGQIVNGYGLGLVGNIVVAIVGAIIAGWLLPLIGFVLVGGILAAIINAALGAGILLIIIGYFQKEAAGEGEGG